MDRPLAGGFLGLTAFQAEGCGGGFAAIFKGARLAPEVVYKGCIAWLRGRQRLCH